MDDVAAAELTDAEGDAPWDTRPDVIAQKGEGSEWTMRVVGMRYRRQHDVVAKAIVCQGDRAWDDLANEVGLCHFLSLGGGLKYHGVKLTKDGRGRDVALVVMERATSSLGVYLRDHPGRADLFPTGAVARMLHAVARQLASLHAERVWHLDIKPDNILYKNGGAPPTGPDTSYHLSDFGISMQPQLTTVGERGQLGWGGTEGYAAPEQWGGRGGVDGRADIHGLGATLYHTLTGRVPGPPGQRGAARGDGVAGDALRQELVVLAEVSARMHAGEGRRIRIPSSLSARPVPSCRRSAWRRAPREGRRWGTCARGRRRCSGGARGWRSKPWQRARTG